MVLVQTPQNVMGVGQKAFHIFKHIQPTINQIRLSRHYRLVRSDLGLRHLIDLIAGKRLPGSAPCVQKKTLYCECDSHVKELQRIKVQQHSLIFACTTG